ncbi:MAG: M1 family peptidase, partial [Chitinophagaceae bacterium]
KYEITVEPNFAEKTIDGKNVLTFKAVSEGKKMQLDMQHPMEIESVTLNTDEKPLPTTRNGNAYYVEFAQAIKKGSQHTLIIKFKGSPREAVTPPWDGGWIWKRDKSGNPWMTVACQGLGASVWYPCKDHQSDEPESASLSIIVPDTLTGVGNGRLVNKTTLQGNKLQFTWEVKNPVNSYNLVPYIGKYVSWKDQYQGEKGPLDITYCALQEDEPKARTQFKQVTPMLKCFEHWFGPYPFYEDGYKLVEAPHLGMEHQSAVAYGNGYQNGYMGRDRSGTGWGTKFDFIIVHESGHEWFANNITTNDIADMWVHEGFTNYSETLFTDYYFGTTAGNEYCIGNQKNISNDAPVIGTYGVNKEGSGDMYDKGGNLVHMIRQLVKDDEKFRKILRGMNSTFYHKTVTSAQVENYLSNATGINLSHIFDQYLRQKNVPVLEYKFTGKHLNYRWADCVKGFNLPVRIAGKKEGSWEWIKPTTQWKKKKYKPELQIKFSVDTNFYVQKKKVA